MNETDQAKKDELYRVIRKVFNLVDTYELSDEMGPGDVSGWDSLGGINLLNAVQDQLRVDLSIEELASINSIGDLRSTLQAKGIYTYPAK